LKIFGTIIGVCIVIKIKAMNQLQINHVSMYDSVVINLNQNATVYSSNVPFSTVVTNYKNAVTGLSSLQTGQINHSQGITVTKEQAKPTL
jgi:hypothetical protein